MRAKEIVVQQMKENAWVNLRIRKPTLADATAIFQLAQSLKLNKNNPQENGFLVYVTSEEGYRIRIQRTPYFYVAERDGELIGYLYCFDDKTTKQLADEGILTGEDVTFPFLFKQKKPFILADQMGIMRKYSYQGIGKALFDEFFKDIIGKNLDALYAEILHRPIRNHASISFCKSIGFEDINELMNSDSHTWGIYKVGREA